MNKYNCTVIFDASASVEVEAETPEQAAELALEMAEGDQHLCHQCSRSLNTGDAIGAIVYDEECTQELLDTTYQPPQRQPLTEKEIRTQFCGAKENFWDFNAGVRYAEAAHGIKGEA